VAAVHFAQVPGSAWEGTETVYFPHSDLDGELLNAIHQAVPDGATYGVNHDFLRAWVTVSRPGNTREVLRAASPRSAGTCLATQMTADMPRR